MGSEKLENSHSNSKPQAKPYGKIVLSLHNCLLPEEKLKNTPSQLEGLDPEIETDLRVLGCELIQTAGILLRLPQVAMATGQVLFQRFYYSKSFIKNPMETTAMGCLCLASKVEEAPMRIRDIINVFHHIKQVNNQKKIQPMIPDQNYFALKTQVIKAERRVLKELGFCVHVKHPHKIVVTYLQTLGFESNRDLVQLAWNYMNDALRTDAFVRYQPETVACACIYLTARKSRILLPKDPPWFILFGATEPEIQEICKQILKLYIRAKPNQEKLEAEIERIKLEHQILQQRMKLQLASGNNTPTSQASPNCKELFTSPSRNNHSKHRSRSKSHNRSKSRSRSRSRSHDKSRSRSRTRSRSRDRRDRDRDRDKYRDMDRDRDRDRDRNRDRNHGDRDRDYDYDRYRDRDRSRSKKKSKYIHR